MESRPVTFCGINRITCGVCVCVCVWGGGVGWGGALTLEGDFMCGPEDPFCTSSAV